MKVLRRSSGNAKTAKEAEFTGCKPTSRGCFQRSINAYQDLSARQDIGRPGQAALPGNLQEAQQVAVFDAGVEVHGSKLTASLPAAYPGHAATNPDLAIHD